MTTDQPNDTQGAQAGSFARSVSPLGKLTEPAKTKLDEVTYFAWLRHCAELGVDEAVELRNMIYMRVHGKTYEAMVAEQQQHDLHRRTLLRLGQAPVGAPDAPSVPGVQ